VLTAIPPQSGRAQTEICRSTTAPALRRRSAATAACCDAVANAPAADPGEADDDRQDERLRQSVLPEALRDLLDTLNTTAEVEEEARH
jgi:hypothetical protein